MRYQIMLSAALVLAGTAALATVADHALQEAVQSPQRSAKFVARDAARHPAAELAFFGLRPDATVVEIWPGGGYWTEILAPYLNKAGTYYVALPVGAPEETKGAMALRARLAADPAVYGRIKFTALGLSSFDIAPPGSADFVLTFRNVHNWMNEGYAPQVFAAFYKALRRGGILGVEEHRGDATKPQDRKRKAVMCARISPSGLPRPPASILIGTSELDAIRKIRRIGRRVCGRCRQATRLARRTMRGMRRSARRTILF